MTNLKVNIRMPIILHDNSVAVYELPNRAMPIAPVAGMALSGPSIPMVGPPDSDFHAHIRIVNYDINKNVIVAVICGPSRPSETCEDVLAELKRLDPDWRLVRHHTSPVLVE